MSKTPAQLDADIAAFLGDARRVVRSPGLPDYVPNPYPPGTHEYRRFSELRAALRNSKARPMTATEVRADYTGSRRKR